MQECTNVVFGLGHCSSGCKLVGVGILNCMSHSKKVLPFLLQLLLQVCLLPAYRTKTYIKQAGLSFFLDVGVELLK